MNKMKTFKVKLSAYSLVKMTVEVIAETAEEAEIYVQETDAFRDSEWTYDCCVTEIEVDEVIEV